MPKDNALFPWFLFNRPHIFYSMVDRFLSLALAKVGQKKKKIFEKVMSRNLLMLTKKRSNFPYAIRPLEGAGQTEGSEV